MSPVESLPSFDPLQDLNVILPPTVPSSLSDAQDLLNDPNFSEWHAQLNLFQNMTFATDDPLLPADEDTESKDGAAKDSTVAADEMKRKRQQLGSKAFDKRRAEITQTIPQLTQPQLENPPPFDFQSFLNSANMPPVSLTPDAMNLHNLLALSAFNPFQNLGFPVLPQGMIPPNLPLPTPPIPAATAAAAAPPPPTKKPRNRKASVAPAAVTPSPTVDDSAESPEESNQDGETQVPTEDKRRRNTQASARFRLKKKEREAAMESKCKELESKVGELERECEALRRENGWLKGLVVGVTGGTGQMPTMPPLGMGMPSVSTAGSTSTTSKRKREGGEQ